MNDHKKKMIAPVIITILFLAYLLFYGFMMVIAVGDKSVLLFLSVPLIALGIGMIYTLYTRIKEIRSGEEDDLSNY